MLLSDDVDRRTMTFDHKSPYYYAFAPHLHESASETSLDLGELTKNAQAYDMEAKQNAPKRRSLKDDSQEEESQEDEEEHQFTDNDDLGSSTSSSVDE